MHFLVPFLLLWAIGKMKCLLIQMRRELCGGCAIIEDTLISIKQGNILSAVREVREKVAQNSSIFDLKNIVGCGHMNTLRETTHSDCRTLGTIWLSSRMSQMALNGDNETCKHEVTRISQKNQFPVLVYPSFKRAECYFNSQE
jgi:hypothetical protein